MKNERRKAATLERELDQLKFSSEAATRESNELLVGLKAQINHLKGENESLAKRLQKSITENQRKLDFERVEHRKTKEDLRICLENEENMLIQIDNLSKKVKFFKANTYSKPNSSQKKSSERVSLIETSRIKQYIRLLTDKVKALKIQHKKEKSQLLEEIKFHQSSIISKIDVLFIRVREESKKNKYLMKELDREKKDHETLKNIHEKFSVKFRSEKSLSKMTALEFSSNCLYDSNQTFDKDKKSSFKKKPSKNHMISMSNLRNSDYNYDFRDMKKSKLNSNSINSSSSVHFRSSVVKNSLGAKDYNTRQKETLNIQERISRLRKKSNDSSRDVSSRRIDVYNREKTTEVPKLSFTEDQENHNRSNRSTEYKSGFASVRLLSQRMEKPGFVLGERSKNVNWPVSGEKKIRGSYFGERDSFLKDGRESMFSNEKYESKNIRFGVLGEISEVKTPKR